MTGSSPAMTMSQIGKASSSTHSRIGVCWSDGVIRLCDEELFGKRPRQHLCATFLHRVFALAEVRSVEINRDQSTAEIHVEHDQLEVSRILDRLATSIDSQAAGASSTFSHDIDPRDLSESVRRVKIRRFGSMLTTWDIVHGQRGRIRLRHEAVRGNSAVANRIQEIMHDVPGVKDCAIRPLTGSVLIRFDPAQIDTYRLLRILDRARLIPTSPHDPLADSKPLGFGLANTSVALAVTGQLAAPALLPACAVLLIGSNLGTFRAAGQQLTRGQFGLPVLYTSIVAATLASGQFISSAVMSWMITFWRRNSRNQMANARRGLLREILHQPQHVRLVLPDGLDVEIAIEDMKPADIILVSAGELIPADGLVREGYGLADERTVRGVQGLVRKQPDDCVLAGSTLEFGELYIEVVRHGLATQSSALARAALAAITPPDESQSRAGYGEAAAERTVPPTLAMAGLGLLIGDVTTAGAILRPDYATGPGLAFPLETLQAIALCIRHGIVIRNPQAIERLAAADLLILDHHPTLERTALELDCVEVFPGHVEDKLLRYACAAFHDLDDERAIVLRDECNTRDIELGDLCPSDFTTDITLLDGSDRVKVGALGTRARDSSRARPQDKSVSAKPALPDSLMVGINGRVAGLIHFRRSDRFLAASALRRLCAKRNLQFGLVSEAPDAALYNLAAALGADFHLGGRSTDDQLYFLRSCRHRGFKVAYIGEGHIDSQLAAEAHVAISLLANGVSDLDENHAAISMLQPQVAKLCELWDIAQIHQQRLKVAYRYALIPNLLCVAGAFVWGFTSLTSVVVTNLATYGIYTRTASSIRSLERQISRASSHRHVLGQRKT
jgi:cation transport ATPase